MFLPQELIIQILLRLPVKSLLRFKCVSKSWLSLITDPHFAKSHFELAAARTHRLVFFDTSSLITRSIDFNASLHDDSASVALNINFLITDTCCNVQILGSCRGFVLLDCCGSLWVWNPSTCAHKQISYSPVDMGVSFYTFLYGFGYDPLTDDYLVVQVSYNPNSDDIVNRVEFFSLRADAWKVIEGVHLSYMNCCDDIRLGLFLNGVIHWLAFRHDVSMEVIVAFDTVERSFSEIPLPVDFECNFNFCDLAVLGESLSLHVSEAEIWVMQEYKVQSSWTKTIDVSIEDIPNQYFSLICSTKSGDIIGTDGRAGLTKCNNEGQLLEYRSYSNSSRGQHQVAVYSDSLLSLPCDSEQAEEDA